MSGTAREWSALLAASAVAFGLAVALTAPKALANGTDPTRVSLPKGPGSVEGLATADLSPSLSTGSANYEIGIAVPPGSAGFGPDLALAYDSGGGVTEIGIGWRVTGAAKIRRRTENGLPHFDATDAFELVGIGVPSDLLEVSPGVFRPAVEDGSFVRVERSSDGTEWEARTKSGVTLRFGADGAVESEGDHVSAYLLREELDRHGHRARFEWDTTEGHALLTCVVWNDFDAASTNEVCFDYETRPDRHRRFSAGIRETITRRLRAVRVDHGGALVRRYELCYGDGAHPVFDAVTLVGKDGVSRLPTPRFDYTTAQISASATQVVTMQNAPGESPKDPDATLTDLDGDGLPDLLVAKAGQFRSYTNHDGVRWLPGAPWGSASPSVSLSQTGVELADLDADGAPDLVVKSGTDAFRYFPRPSATNFAPPVAISTVPSFSFEDPDVRLADMDGDRRIDVVVTTAAGIAIGYDVNGSDWTEPAVVGSIDAAQPLRFSDGQTSLCDVNGDRVEDICSLHSGGLAFWLGRGRGRFESAEEATGVPEFDAAAPYQLVDVNGDGWVDLLRVDVAEVSIALAVAEGRFGPVQEIRGTPVRGPNTQVELADMNASGTTDVVWIDPTGDGATSFRYLELFPSGRAGLLRHIDNGLGKVQSIDYEPAALGAARARDAGTPWATRLNVAMPVVEKTTTDVSLGDPPIVTEFTYRDGTYDPVERTFAGFGGSLRRQIGDAATPTLLTDASFDTGLSRRELRGALLSEETRTETGSVFSRTTNVYSQRTLGTVPDGRFIGYSFKSQERVEHVEGDPANARTTLTEFEEDPYGNVTEERRWGETSGADYLAGADESMIVRTFAADPDDWLLGYLATEEVTEAAGQRVSFSRRYYDGSAFVGLPLGQVSRGDVAREEEWVGPGDGDFELVMETSYNDDGLPTETRDGRGGGRSYTWAPDHTSIASERVKLGSGVALVEVAQVDGAFGALLSTTDYSGAATSYEYDPFGRLTKVVRPGDSSALPTVRYSYEAASPLSRVVTESRIISGASDVERSETVTDGGGRERGTFTRDGNRWILAGVPLFDARGNPRHVSFPRSVDADGYATPPLLDATGAGTDTFRDALARAVRTRSPSGIETRTEYAPLETRHWDGGQADATSTYEHTPVVEQKDGLGRVVAHVQTLRGRALTASYAYDAGGALVSRTDPEGNVARYDYDGRGRRIAVHDPDVGEHRFTYDATGNVVARRYPDGVTARFTFDLAGRPLTEDWDGDGAPEITRTWDVEPGGTSDANYRGRLARVVEPSGSVEHTYDVRGRVTATRYEIDGVTYVATSAYDARDREILHGYPDGSSIEIRRNARGQIAGYGAAVDIDYGEDGLESERRFSTGVVAKSAYDGERRRAELTFVATSGSVIEHLGWRYDPSGDLASVTDLRAGVTPARDRSETYSYDNLHRLSAVSGAWGQASYRYSPSGNLLSRASTVSALVVGAVTYGALPHAPVAFDGRVVSLDARGRMTSDGTRTYTWNAIDQLVAVERGDGGVVENVFGDDGVRRVRVEHRPDGTSSTTHFIDTWTEAHDGRLTRYVVHAGQRIVELAPDTGAVRAGTSARGGGRAASATSIGLLVGLAFALTAFLKYFLGLRKRDWPATLGAGLVSRLATYMVACVGLSAALVACGRSDPKPAVATAGPHGTVRELGRADTLIVADLLGSGVDETTGNGEKTSEFAVFPFGAARYDTSRAEWKFAGSPRDGAVGLDHMGARFYAPELGVWTSGDPVVVTDPERLLTPDFAAANPYVYAKQSPVVATDRDGHFWQVALAAVVGGLVGGGIEAGRQYFEHGRVEDWGRVGAAAAGGAVSGIIVAAYPAAALAADIGSGAASNAASGIAERLVESHGKDAGTLREVAIDAALGAATAGIVRGATAVIERQVARNGGANVVSRQDLGRYFVAKGYSRGEASGFARSFGGPITTRSVEEGEHFVRYTSRSCTKGNFLTRATFESPKEAVEALNLKPFGNRAGVRQQVFANRADIVFEGQVGGGASGVIQTLVSDKNAFTFGLGVKW